MPHLHPPYGIVTLVAALSTVLIGVTTIVLCTENACDNGSDLVKTSLIPRPGMGSGNKAR